MAEFNHMSFARLKTADKAFIAEANKTANGRAKILGELRRFVANLSGRPHVPDDELFALGCELRELWPAARNNELIQAISRVLSEVELRVVSSGLQPGFPVITKEAQWPDKVEGTAQQREPRSDVRITSDRVPGDSNEPLTLTAEIVASYVSANSHVEAADIPNIIRQVRAALSEGTSGRTEVTPAQTKTTSAQVRKSITPDALMSFVDNKPYKTLKRHLSRHGMSMDDYRKRYGLPSDYPSVAPNYAAARAEMAKKLGLGTQRREARRAEGSAAFTGQRKRSTSNS